MLFSPYIRTFFLLMLAPVLNIDQWCAFMRPVLSFSLLALSTCLHFAGTSVGDIVVRRDFGEDDLRVTITAGDVSAVRTFARMTGNSK